MRIAYIVEDGLSNISEDIIETLVQTTKELKKHVANVECVEIGNPQDAYHLLWEAFYLGGDQGQGTKKILSMLGVTKPSTLMQEFLHEAEKSILSVTQFRNLFREIDLYRIKLLESLQNYDVLISPVASTVAKKHGTALQECKDMTHCMIHSLTGWPVTVLRCGTSKDGLPIGLQIAAKPWQDHVSLALTTIIESITGGWQPPNI